jgi:hypothetical protein
MTMKIRVLLAAALLIVVTSLIVAASIEDGELRFKCPTEIPCDPSDEQIAALNNDKHGERMLIVLGGFSLGALLVGCAAVDARRPDSN